MPSPALLQRKPLALGPTPRWQPLCHPVCGPEQHPSRVAPATQPNGRCISFFVDVSFTQEGLSQHAPNCHAPRSFTRVATSRAFPHFVFHAPPKACVSGAQPPIACLSSPDRLMSVSPTRPGTSSPVGTWEGTRAARAGHLPAVGARPVRHPPVVC